MDQESKPRKTRRPRRSFTEEFKAGAVRLVLDQGKSVSAVARDLDLTASALQAWVTQVAVPGQADHRFRRMSITRSTACRSLIPRHADR